MANYKELLIAKITSESERLLPNKKPKFRERYATKYVDGILKELNKALHRPRSNRFPDQIPFSQSLARLYCKEYVVNRKNKYLFDLFQSSQKTALVLELHKGHTNYLSMVKINPRYENILLECIGAPQPIVSNKPNKLIKMDLDACYDYRNDVMDRLEQITTKGALRKKLLENKVEITYFLQAAKNISEHYYIEEYWETKDTGREYAKAFPSLQTCAKEVRHAVLGRCWRYDFKACSYAVMLGWAKALKDEHDQLYCGKIEDYIMHRDKIRKAISKETGIKVDVVKQIFTALGFGAKVVNNPFMSIRGHISKAYGAPEDKQLFDALVNNQTFKFVKEELDMVNKIILKHLDPNDLNDNIRQYHQLTSKNKLKTDAQKLAWIYQATESLLLERFIEMIKEDTNLDPILTVHDCVYYKWPIPNDAWQSAITELRKSFPDLMMEETAIWPIASKEQFAKRHIAPTEVEEKQHRDFIEQEEMHANKQFDSIAKIVQHTKEELFAHQQRKDEERRRELERLVNRQVDDIDENGEYQLPTYREEVEEKKEVPFSLRHPR